MIQYVTILPIWKLQGYTVSSISLRKALGVLAKSSSFSVKTTTQRQRDLFDDLKDYLYVTPEIEHDFEKCLRALLLGEYVFLCGSSGDGKSEILSRSYDQYKDRYSFHLDATHSFSPHQSVIDALNELFDRAGDGAQPLVVGINIGMLANFAKEGAERHSVLRSVIERFLDSGERTQGAYHFLDFESYPKFRFNDDAGSYSSFIRQVLMQVDKLYLYQVMPPAQLAPLLTEREWWLKGENTLASVPDYPEGFVVAHIENDSFFVPHYQMTERGVLQVELPYALLGSLIQTCSAPALYGDMPMHTATGFADILAQAFGLGPKQQLRLRKLILDAYELAGISRADASTWSRPAPTLAQVCDLYLEQEKVEEDSLYAALDSLVTYEIFETMPDKVSSRYELLDGVTVIELAGYSPQIQNLVVALTLDLFYSQMQKRGKPKVNGDYRQITKMTLVDEADNFMSQDFPSLRKILKEGREYGVGVILSTQDLSHFKTGENNYGSYILTWVVHRVVEIKNADIKAIFNKDDKTEQEQLMETIHKLDKYFSLYIDGDKKVSMMRDRTFWEL